MSEKGNEITAMGCQKEIAAKIIENDADYILAVKGNQGSLHRSISDTIRFESLDTTDISEDCGHGRVETGTCKAYSNLSHIEHLEQWIKLSTVLVVESHVFEKATGKERTEQRMYISSLPANAK
ncbi:MAG: ISAs1 family transposase [Bacteroidales bacterium]